MCAFGMKSADHLGIGLVYKPTKLLTNILPVVETTSRSCTRDHRHVHLMSGRAAGAAIYPEKLCHALLDGIQVWMEARRQMVMTLNGMEHGSDDLCEEDEAKPEREGVYWDDVKGGELDRTLVKKARQEELDVFAERNVYEVVPRSSIPGGSKIVGVRWVETDKGVPAKPKIRSRLVCQ